MLVLLCSNHISDYLDALLYFTIELLLGTLATLNLSILSTLIIQKVVQREVEFLIELLDLQHEILECLLVRDLRVRDASGETVLHGVQVSWEGILFLLFVLGLHNAFDDVLHHEEFDAFATRLFSALLLCESCLLGLESVGKPKNLVQADGLFIINVLIAEFGV